MIMKYKNHEEEEVVEDDAVEEETSEEATEDTEEDSTDWKAKADELQGRLKRAETKLSKDSSKPVSKPSKSNNLDYGAKAYLASHDLKVKGTKELEFVQNELKQSGQDLDSLLENDYFTQRLEKFRALDKTDEATPKGTRSNGVATDSVEYWMTKPIEDVPADMRTKVVNAKLEKETTRGVFYNS